MFTLVFRVYGLKQPPVVPKVTERISPSRSAGIPTDKRIQLLIEKGVLSQEEGRARYLH